MTQEQVIKRTIAMAPQIIMMLESEFPDNTVHGVMWTLIHAISEYAAKNDISNEVISKNVNDNIIFHTIQRVREELLSITENDETKAPS